MKKYVQIQSSININVTAGLNMKNMTKVDSDIPNRLMVKPVWPKLTVLIKQGNALYPSYIVEWNSVKALVRNKLITIGMETDDAGGDAELIALSKKLDVAMADPGYEPVDDNPTPVEAPKRVKKAEAKPAKEESLEEIVED